MMNNSPADLTNVDNLLSAFFKSELPTTWKAPQIDAADRPMPASRIVANRSAPATLTGSRVSLAVSVALLLGGCWLLSERTSDAPVPPRAGVGVKDGTAKKKYPLEIRPLNDGTISKPMP